MTTPIREVLKNHVNGNPVVECLLYNRGTFYDKLHARVLQSANSHSAAEDHSYLPGEKTLTLEEFIVQDAEDNAPDFDPIPHLKNFKPCSVEPERLFSNCRLSQNFLQYRLLPENLARNVFLSKNKPVVTIE